MPSLSNWPSQHLVGLVPVPWVPPRSPSLPHPLKLTKGCTELARGNIAADVTFTLTAQKILQGMNVCVRDWEKGRQAARMKKRNQMQGARRRCCPYLRNKRPASWPGVRAGVGVRVGWAGSEGRRSQEGVWPEAQGQSGAATSSDSQIQATKFKVRIGP